MRKTAGIFVKVEPEKAVELKKCAHAAEMNVSEFVRVAVREKIRRMKQDELAEAVRRRFLQERAAA